MEYLNLTTPYGQTYEVCFEAERYANNHNLALQMYFKDENGMLRNWYLKETLHIPVPTN